VGSSPAVIGPASIRVELVEGRTCDESRDCTHWISWALLDDDYAAYDELPVRWLSVWE
jgi:hypothetical protein